MASVTEAGGGTGRQPAAAWLDHEGGVAPLPEPSSYAPAGLGRARSFALSWPTRALAAKATSPAAAGAASAPEPAPPYGLASLLKGHTPLAAMLAGRLPEFTLECAIEGRFRFVSHFSGDFRDAFRRTFERPRG